MTRPLLLAALLLCSGCESWHVQSDDGWNTDCKTLVGKTPCCLKRSTWNRHVIDARPFVPETGCDWSKEAR